MFNSPFIKAVKVLDSCNNVNQMEMAFRFIKIVGEQYNDKNETFRILANMWSVKLEELRNQK